jgi:outer membrane protein TolC
MFAGREATDPLPVSTLRISNFAASQPNDMQAVIAGALGRRADYLAAKKRQEEAALLAGAAKNQLKPQLDLQFNTGYSGLRDGTRPDQYIISTVTGVHGVDATGGIRYQFPVENRAASGSVLQARAVALQAGYRSQESARNIASAVIIAIEGVRNAALQLEKVDQSVTFFQTALGNEREKYRLGVGSLVEVLTVEDRLTEVLVAQAQAGLGYAVALAQFRQSTGTIVEPDKAVQRIDPSVFLSLPARKD